MKQYAKTSPVTITMILAAAVVAASKYAAGKGWISGPVTESDVAYALAVLAVVVNEIRRRRAQILGWIRAIGKAWRGQ